MEGEARDGTDAGSEEAVKVTDRRELTCGAGVVAERGQVEELDELIARARGEQRQVVVQREGREARLVRGDCVHERRGRR